MLSKFIWLLNPFHRIWCGCACRISLRQSNGNSQAALPFTRSPYTASHRWPIAPRTIFSFATFFVLPSFRPNQTCFRLGSSGRSSTVSLQIQRCHKGTSEFATGMSFPKDRFRVCSEVPSTAFSLRYPNPARYWSDFLIQFESPICCLAECINNRRTSLTLKFFMISKIRFGSASESWANH